MIYELSLMKLPTVKECYSVTRNTVWQIADPFHILIFIREGICDLTLDNVTYRLCPGDIFFIPKGALYTRKSVNLTMCTMTYIHFETDEDAMPIASEIFSQKLVSMKCQIERSYFETEPIDFYPTKVYIENRTNLPVFSELLQRVLKINLFSTGRPLMCHLQASVILCEVLVALSQYTTEKHLEDASLRKVGVMPEKLKRAMGYIMRHYTEPITLDRLAEVCALSKQHLIRHFRATLNTTPIRYLIDYRLARAKELLFKHPELTVKEIAYELGFENPHYFTRAFSQANGESPTSYRERTVHFDATKQKEQV